MDTAATREFPTAVIASLSTGIMLCKFDVMHEAAEFLMGHPIWTHHFASRDLWKAMQARIVEQVPQMPISIEGVTAENYQEKISEIERMLGPVVTLKTGDGSTAMHPLEGIPDGQPVAVIQV